MSSILGVEVRAKECRAALNRLHREVDYALENAENRAVKIDLENGMDGVVEAIAILTNIAHRLAPLIEVNPERAEALRAHAEFYRSYYEVPR